MKNQLKNVLSAIDDINSKDVNITLSDGEQHPKELIYGQRMTACLTQHWPQASELLQIAVRAQHVKRWHLKRSEFEQGKAGYYQWRIALGKFHAELTATTMQKLGYSAEQAAQTASIICKENLRDKSSSQLNSDSQTLEDVACLVFLEHYFDDFASQYIEKDNEAKIVRIVQLTWKKMSEDAHNIALKLTLPEHLSALVAKALA
ncbi:hypothetical protein A9Q74_04420 [Colwellia sp. 39_35_sub15_T18]|nr:hypothetical protein A9Q74_04420 [Colwellia sp. 39_35_sub15_T18]